MSLDDFTAHQFDHAGLDVRIVQDTDASYPRDDYDTPTRWLSWSRDGGDESVSEWEESDLREARLSGSSVVLVRFSDYGSSGSRLYAVDDLEDANGAFVVDRAAVRKEWNGSTRHARRYMHAEIKELDEYFQGNVYGIVICRRDSDEQLESVWGFIGDPFKGWIVDEAKEMAEAICRELCKAAVAESNERRWAARNEIATVG